MCFERIDGSGYRPDIKVFSLQLVSIASWSRDGHGDVPRPTTGAYHLAAESSLDGSSAALCLNNLQNAVNRGHVALQSR